MQIVVDRFSGETQASRAHAGSHGPYTERACRACHKPLREGREYGDRKFCFRVRLDNIAQHHGIPVGLQDLSVVLLVGIQQPGETALPQIAQQHLSQMCLSGAGDRIRFDCIVAQELPERERKERHRQILAAQTTGNLAAQQTGSGPGNQHFVGRFIQQMQNVILPALDPVDLIEDENNLFAAALLRMERVIGCIHSRKVGFCQITESVIVELQPTDVFDTAARFQMLIDKLVGAIRLTGSPCPDNRKRHIAYKTEGPVPQSKMRQRPGMKVGDKALKRLKIHCLYIYVMRYPNHNDIDVIRYQAHISSAWMRRAKLITASELQCPLGP